MGSSATKIFRYDGTDLSLVGGTITGGTFQTSATASTGVKITSTALAGYNGSVQTVNIATDGSGWVGLTGTKAISWTTAGAATIAGFTANATQLYAGSVATRIQLDTGSGIHLGATAFADAPFSVSLAGALKATSATIGAWKVNTTSIYTGTEDHSGYTTNAGDVTLYSNGTDASIHAKNFYIDVSGNLTATSATLTGDITANTGYLG